MSTASSAAAAAPPKKKSAGGNIYVAFVPWVLFGIVSQRDTMAAASIVALAAAILISIPSFVAGRPKILDMGAIVAFAGFTAVALLASDDVVDWFGRYERGVSAALLGLIALGSLLFTPFTEQYARETVPEERWSSPRFKEVNRQLTAMWGFVFLAMVPSHIVAGLVDTRRGDTFFNWVVPILLIVWAVKRTARVTEEAQAAGPAAVEPPPAA